ncbi:MAG: enoyl-CoA hydratase-related protein, partial [Gallionellaceae bacterium]
MSCEYINVVIDNHIATIAINRPARLNALNRMVILELHRVFYSLELNSEVRVIILTGTGEKAFVAGADIAE